MCDLLPPTEFERPLGASVGVHLACRDTGTEVKGAESAVSVAYTVYVDSSNEVFVAVEVVLVGAHHVELNKHPHPWRL